MKNSVLAPRSVGEMAQRIGTAEAHPAVWNQILRRSLRWLRNTIALAVVALPLILGGCAAQTTETPPTTEPTTQSATPTPVDQETIKKHNQATLQNLANSMNNPTKFDGDPLNAFKDAHGHVYADGTIIVDGTNALVTHEITNTNAPAYVGIKNVRNIGTILNANGTPEYWILKVGNDKYLAINFADMPEEINIGAELTQAGAGTGGNATGNPFYTPTEVAKMFGNTDDNNVNGLALDIGFAINATIQGNPSADVMEKFKAEEARSTKFINALLGYGTDPNLLTGTQVKNLANGTGTLTSAGLIIGPVSLPEDDDYLLNH